MPLTRREQARVLDARGAPLFGAVVERVGLKFGASRQFGGAPKADPLAVTDAAGEFILALNEDATGMFVQISARQHALRRLRVPIGSPQTIKLLEGATLTGRLVKDGKPLRNVGVGLSAQNRRVESYLGHYEVSTNADGQFTFTNLPPNADYQFYGVMETLGPHGTLPVRPVHIGRDRGKIDLGDLAVRSAHRVAGRVILRDGKNGSYDQLNRLVGRIQGDVTGLQLLLEKTAIPNGPIDLALLPKRKDGPRPHDLPLRGVEPKADR